MNRHVRRAIRPALLLALPLLLPAATAQAGISSATTSNNSDVDDYTSGFFSGDGRASTLNTLTDDGTTLETEYRFTVGAWNDSYGTSADSLTSDYTIEFTVTAPGDYILQVDQTFDAAIQTIESSLYGTATIELNAIAGSQTGGMLDSGTLNPNPVSYLETTGYGKSSSSLHTTIADTATAVISGTSNNVSITHTLTFSWDSSCDSTAYSVVYQGGHYCGVRSGISSDYGNSATDYSTESGTAADDGHVVTITLTELSPPDLCAGVVCNNGDQCNDDGGCDSGTGACNAATAKADGTLCDDADSGTGNDICTGGNCAGSDLCAGIVCSDGDQCNDDGSCDPQTGACNAPIPKADGTLCDDADSGTGNDICTGGNCAGSDLCAGIVCSDGDQCNDDGSCDPQTGACNAPIPKADGTLCDDADSGTGNDICTGGNCAGSDLCAGIVCSDGDQCNDDGSCDPQTGACGAATPKANGTSCDDTDQCTIDDQCVSGSCAGDADICGDGTTQTSCGEECDDGNTSSGDGCSDTCASEGPAVPGSSSAAIALQLALTLLAGWWVVGRYGRRPRIRPRRG